MRIVALEEHLTLPEFSRRIPTAATTARGWPGTGNAWHPPGLDEVGAGRVADMDAAGVTVQVLSVSGPGAEVLGPAEGTAFARDYNDRIAKAVREHPGRFAGFAHLPTTAPEAAADELERAVRDLGFVGALINGTTEGQFLDAPRFAPILARAEALDVPIYLHPAPPPPAVQEAYYAGLPGETGFSLACPGFGWHAETAIHVIRLALSGAFDRHRGLKLIVGHMGEYLPMNLARLDSVFRAFAKAERDRPIGRTVQDQVWITTSGFFSVPPFLAALTAFGPDRILFSVDYPYSPNQTGVAFLNAIPVSPADRYKIAHANADALLKLTPG